MFADEHMSTKKGGNELICTPDNHSPQRTEQGKLGDLRNVRVPLLQFLS